MSSPEKGAGLAPGLYLVATPIGNLEDITLRALRVLKSVDRIFCEDTRETQHLLQHFGISTPMTSCHEHNEESRAAEMVGMLEAGGSVAMVSDAGMPGISDPGMRLAQAAIAAGLPVVPIPGANAALTGLVGSGLSAQRFLFCGFLPAKPGARKTELERLRALVSASGEALTLIFYEAPHRILEMLEDVKAEWGPECPVVIARELTKLHEEFLRGTVVEVARELAGRERVRGEIVVLVGATPGTQQQAAPERLGQQVLRLVSQDGMSEMDALKRVARERGIGKSEAYREWQRERGRQK